MKNQKSYLGGNPLEGLEVYSETKKGKEFYQWLNKSLMEKQREETLTTK